MGKGLEGSREPSGRCAARAVWWEVWVIGTVLCFEEGLMGWGGLGWFWENRVRDSEVPGKGQALLCGDGVEKLGRTQPYSEPSRHPGAGTWERGAHSVQMVGGQPGSEG